MTDIVDSATRSRMMAGIRSGNTRPELALRRALHARGFRYRLHVGGLPGRPDLVLSRHSTVVFVHGCFWRRRLQHSAMDIIGLLHLVEPFGEAADALGWPSERRKKQQNGERHRTVVCETEGDPAHGKPGDERPDHRRPLRQSSSRA